MIVSRKIRIVHLDDHKLFQAGIRTCVETASNNIYLQGFQYSDDAFICVKNSLDSGEPVDLIITDLCHNQQDGYEFAKSIRRYECSFLTRIPILLISMHSPKSDNIIQKGLDERLFDFYLGKNSSCEQIWEAVERLTCFRRGVLQEQ